MIEVEALIFAVLEHYLSNTVANWISKHPDSVLRHHFKPAFDFELDYAHAGLEDPPFFFGVGALFVLG
jgi:hypothetical protein